MVRLHHFLAIFGLLSSAVAKDLVLKAKFDPTQADTMEDAAWNCIVDFADDNPRDICSHAVTRGPLQKFADMCAKGNLLMFDNLHYEYCKNAAIKKNGKYFHPHKRPCMRCADTSNAKPTITTVVNINIIEGVFTAPTTLTIAPSGKPIATVTISDVPKTTSKSKSQEVTKTSFKTVIKTVEATDVPAAERTCLPPPERDSGKYDNGKWCAGKYEEP